MRTKSRFPSRSVTTSTGSVGQILYRGGRLCGGSLILSRYGRPISSQVSLLVKRPHIAKPSLPPMQDENADCALNCYPLLVWRANGQKPSRLAKALQVSK